MDFLPESWGYVPIFAPAVFVFLILLYYQSSKTFDLAVKRLLKSFSEDKIARSYYFRNCWKRYSKTFLQDTSEQWKTPQKAEVYFNDQTIIAKKARLRFYAGLPSFIFGLGVITLFAGLILGVLRFNVETHEEIMHSMKFFFLVVAGAFMAFVLALLLSVLFRFINRAIFKRVSERITLLCDFLDERYNMSVLEERKIAMKEHLEVLKEISQGSNGPEREWREAQSRLFHELLTNAAQQAEFLQSLSKVMTGSMERMSERMGAMAEPLGSLPAQFKALQEDLREGLARMAESVNETTRFGNQAVQANIREMSAGFIDSVEVFRNSLSGYADESKGHTLSVSQEIKESFERSARELGDMIRSVRETFYDGLVREKENMGRSAQQAREMMEASAADIELAVRDLRRGQAEALDKLGQNADMIAETARDLRGAAHEHQAVRERLDEAMEGVSHSLDALREAAESMAESTDNGRALRGEMTPEASITSVAALIKGGEGDN